MATEGCVGENAWLRRIEAQQLEYDLTPVGGLALVGHYLKAMGPQWGVDADRKLTHLQP